MRTPTTGARVLDTGASAQRTVSNIGLPMGAWFSAKGAVFIAKNPSGRKRYMKVRRKGFAANAQKEVALQMERVERHLAGMEVPTLKRRRKRRRKVVVHEGSGDSENEDATRDA